MTFLDHLERLRHNSVRRRNARLAALRSFIAMRQGELLQLEWRMIDKKRRIAFLLNPELITTGEPRAVPLSSKAMAALDGLPKAIKGKVIPLGWMTLYKAFERACNRAGIEITAGMIYGMKP